MKNRLLQKILRQNLTGTRPLYMVAFMMAFSIGIWWVSLPFVIKRLGGSDSQVGYCFALNMGIYAFGCIITGSLLYHLNPRRALLSGVSIITVMAIGMCLVVLYSSKGASSPEQTVPSSYAITVLIILFALVGLFMSFFWPFLIGWLSANQEGANLNRRLGNFNIGCAVSGIISPFIGGFLVKISSLLALSAALISLSLCLFFLYITKVADFNSRPVDKPEGISANKNTLSVLDSIRFRRVARLALFGSFACFAAVRTQLGILFKYDLGFSESDFGVIVMILAASYLLVMSIMRRWVFWHYKFPLLIFVQLTHIACLILILNTHSMWIFGVSAVALGLGVGYCYASHLYYGISGSSRRSAQMAIHEIILSAGVVTGSILGGYLSDHINRYSPYWFGLTIISIMIMIQILVWNMPVKKPLTERCKPV